ncbi:MAG: hypothetical protein K6A23_01540 [Butyrivibrio sp.]|nr:hypothetical protein [Butyrivibrio sp.]
MRGKIKRLEALLVAMLFLAGLLGTSLMQIYAEENIVIEEQPNEELEVYEEQLPQAQITEFQDSEEQNTEEAPSQETLPENYNISVNDNYLDFGSLQQGDVVSGQNLILSNTGTTDVNLTWVESDPDDAFVVDFGESFLAGGKSTTFVVRPNTDAQEGTHRATIRFASTADPGYLNGVEIRAVVVIQPKKPTITGVVITPNEVSLSKGSSYTFQTSVYGTGDYSSDVTYVLRGHGNEGTYITNDGTLVVAADETSNSLAVIVTSEQDYNYQAFANINLITSSVNVAASASPKEGGVVTGIGAVTKGSSVTVSASANNGYRFVSWNSGNTVVSTSNTYTIKDIQNDVNLVAKFERSSCNVKIKASNDKGGTVTGGGKVNVGGSMGISAKVNDGYKFEGWKEGDKIISKEKSYTVSNITSDRTITAVFTENKYKVSLGVVPQDTGKVEGAGSYTIGKNATIKATAYDGYVFSSWTVNGQVVSNDAKFELKNIKQDINVVANFVKKQAKSYTIESGLIKGSENKGVITPTGKISVTEGQSAAYTITPSAGYKVEMVYIDGKAYQAVNNYTFTNVKGGHSIAVSFTAIPQAVTPAAQAKTNTSNTANVTAKASTQTTQNSSSSTASTTQKTYNSDGSIKADAEDAASGHVEQNIVEVEEEDIPLAAPEINQQEDVGTGVLGTVGISEYQARLLIQSGADGGLLRKSFDDGYLTFHINNGYGSSTQETAEELYYEDPSLPNLGDVVNGLFSENEKIYLYEGGNVAVNISISDNTDSVAENIQKYMYEAVGVRAQAYFEFNFIKTVNGNSENITQLPDQMVVKVNVPDSVLDNNKKGKEYVILRLHDQKVDVLADLDDDPNTITFKTDCFSQYAIGVEVANENLILACLSIAMGVTVTVILIILILILHNRRLIRKHIKH